ncbi:gluconokinase [Deinococcus malanensis]|uniref:Gluconokinase n=2 Tax=Deinococcus malanensis TaxID=1706855 RepID=A0ABQ2ER16_9DEIO|nr:gluconokinase [Deinococcus malanensis]
MGVAGSGKTTLGRALADRLGWQFLDADDFHDPAAVEQMARGVGLTDEQRRPWLERVHGALQAQPHAVLACSALTRGARDILRGAQVRFLFLDVPAPVLSVRLQQRQNHPVGPTLLSSQLTTLELPGAQESDVLTLRVSADETPHELLRRTLQALEPHHAGERHDA